MINKGFYEDNRLSAKAKGILGYLLSRPDGWVTRTEQITSVMTDGLTAIKSGLRELEQNGYFRRFPVRDTETGKISHWVKDVFEVPQVENPPVENPSDGNPSDGKPTPIVNIDIANIDIGNKEDSNIPPNLPLGRQKKQPDSEQLNLGFPDSGTQQEDSELNRKTPLPKESSSLAKQIEILDTPEGSSPGANYSATANENNSHSHWDSTVNSDNGNPGKLKKGGKKGKKDIPSLSPEELNYFFQAYHAEKPSNFKTHTRKLLAEDEERIAKLVGKYGDRSLDMFVAALTYCREQTWAGWREGEKLLAFLFYNNKVPMYADRHRDAMESDPQYRARVEGRAPSMDVGRQPKVYNSDGNEVTGAAAEAFNAVASNPLLQKMLGL
ncbi:MAG: hypothetical protein F6K21_04520 [Symploca sp. SIO2D2]|nr:hypothetical protein [Symploca sp. SIO2D2]